jgi:hypothetical protein
LNMDAGKSVEIDVDAIIDKLLEVRG